MRPSQPVVGHDAVPGGEDAVEVGAHLPVDADRSADPELGAGRRGELGVRPHADDHQDQVGEGGMLGS